MSAAESSARTGTRVSRRLLRAIEAIAGTERLLVALDFDGTLAPFVDKPENARMLPGARAALNTLRALSDTALALISGRPLASLAQLSEASDDVMLIGSHGVEARFDGVVTPAVLDGSERALLAQLKRTLVEIANGCPGSVIEQKPVGLGLHTRNVAQDAARKAQSAARAAADKLGGFTVRGGKDIVEFSVREATKGDGVRRLRERVAASTVLFAGDDVTDEDGFLTLGALDVGIKVGDGETAARYRVGDPDALSEVLAVLAALRTDRLAERPAEAPGGGGGAGKF